MALTRLGVYLRDTGTSQAWLAEAIGVSNSTIQNWVSGKYSISRRHREKLLDILSQRAALSLDGLCGDQDVDWDTSGTPFDQLSEQSNRLSVDERKTVLLMMRYAWAHGISDSLDHHLVESAFHKIANSTQGNNESKENPPR